VNDWRADNAKFLRGTHLHRSKFTKRSESCDHEHCAACWAKFAEFDGPDIQHEGYTTAPDYPHGARYEWVCLACFADLKAEMGWSDVPMSNFLYRMSLDQHPGDPPLDDAIAFALMADKVYRSGAYLIPDCYNPN
jgi:hypothetical protein